MSKKPASLTSDLLARKGEAEPSTIDPSARMTLSAGPGYDEEYGGGRGEGDHRDDNGMDYRPLPPEPEIIYTAEETSGGGSSMRFVIVAVLGLIIVGGIFLAVTGNEPNSVAPVSPNIVSEAPAPAAPAPADVTSNDVVPETVTTAPESVAPVAEAPVVETPVVATPAPEVETPVAEAPAPVAIEVPVAPVKAAEPVAPAAPAQASTPQSGGAYVVQLLALQDEAAARAAWSKVSAKHKSVLGNHALDIEEADLGAKGTWYRVRAAGFKTKAAANDACAKLKAAGQDCLTKKR
jgi:hypothetical protein